MRKTEQFRAAVLVFICLLLAGCGGGGSVAGNPPPSATPTPTPVPTPSPTPTPTSAVVWKQALPPAQGANLLALAVNGSTVLGAGVETPSGTGTNAYAASFVDNGTSATAGTPTSLSESSSILGMTLVGPATAFAVGTDTPSGSTAAVPAVFTLSPTNGAFLSVKLFTCAAGTALQPILANATAATAVVQDGSTIYVALTLTGSTPHIVKTDLAGNLDCSQTAIDVPQGNTNGTIHSMIVNSQSVIVGGEFNTVGVPQGFAIFLDKATGAQTFAVVIENTPVAAVVMDASGSLYVGGSQIQLQPNTWVIEKINPPFTATGFTVAWATRAIPPPAGQTTNADRLVSLMLSPTTGKLVAVGQTTPAGAPDINNVQTSVAVLDPGTGATTKAIEVNVFPGDQEHPASAVLGASNTIYIGGQKFTPPNVNFGAWLAKLTLQ